MRGLIALIVALSLVSCASVRKRKAEQVGQVEIVRNERLTAQMESIADAATIEKVIELYVETSDSGAMPKRLKMVRKETTVEKRHSHSQAAVETVDDSVRAVEVRQEKVVEKRKNTRGGKWMILGLMTILVLIIGYKLKKMKNTIEVIVAMDCDEIRKTVYAESALLAVSQPNVGRPKMITEDNRKLINLFLESTFVEISTMLRGFIDAEKFDLSEEGMYKFPLMIPVEYACLAPVLRRHLEAAHAAGVLSRCYNEHRQISELFEQRLRETVSRIRLAMAGTNMNLAPNY